jgi:hypothetical protein
VAIPGKQITCFMYHSCFLFWLCHGLMNMCARACACVKRIQNINVLNLKKKFIPGLTNFKFLSRIKRNSVSMIWFSSFRRVVKIEYCLLLGSSPACEYKVSTFRKHVSSPSS